MELSLPLQLFAALIAVTLTPWVSGKRYDGGIGDFYYPDAEALQFFQGDTVNITYGSNFTESHLFINCSIPDQDEEGE